MKERPFVSELKQAGVFESNSKFVISEKLEEIVFSSGLTDGHWITALTISNSRNEGHTTSTRYGFSGSFLGDKACGDVFQAFVPAVQKLLERVIHEPRFKQIAI